MFNRFLLSSVALSLSLSVYLYNNYSMFFFLLLLVNIYFSVHLLMLITNHHHYYVYTYMFVVSVCIENFILFIAFSILSFSPPFLSFWIGFGCLCILTNHKLTSILCICSSIYMIIIENCVFVLYNTYHFQLTT